MVFHDPREQVARHRGAAAGGPMTRIRTSLLIALLIVSGLTSAIAYSHLLSTRDRAQASAADLARCQTYLADLRATRSSDAPAIRPATDDSAINQLLREAALASNTTSALTGIEPGQATRIEGTDYQETPVFLRLEPTPLKEL